MRVSGFEAWNLEVHAKAVSAAIYPVPTKRMTADPKTSYGQLNLKREHTKIEVGVPSSSHWKPISALRRRTQNVAVMSPIWIAENH